ncbi:YbaY family lipoprotein [Aeromicrobium stalagmiti]|uniref:YbaY family lipoprotein n=1 Tax=Aeromicrobium stalagmiti TaxID=2738988 RepID=UPI00156805BC|nr:YbaY family lipoprotein [Aeromicrobium stalagmiti]NRQ48971.1 YbaY family lipoprotein [Aeromicrobium stalagmiti]
MSSELLTISGTVFFRERVALPPGAVATIKLVDGDGEVLAGAAIDAPGVPVEFALTVDPAFVTDVDKLFVWAALRSEVGVWGTTELVPLDGGDNAVLVTKIDED